jgi:hypothetical protein
MHEIVGGEKAEGLKGKRQRHVQIPSMWLGIRNRTGKVNVRLYR